MTLLIGCAKKTNFIYKKIQKQFPIITKKDLIDSPVIGIVLNFRGENGSYDKLYSIADIKNSLSNSINNYVEYNLSLQDLSITHNIAFENESLDNQMLTSLNEKYPQIRYAIVINQIGDPIISRKCSIETTSDSYHNFNTGTIEYKNERVEKKFNTIYMIDIEASLYDLPKHLLIAKSKETLTKLITNLETTPLLDGCLGPFGDIFDFIFQLGTWGKCKPEQYRYKFCHPKPVHPDEFGKYL